jgi:hypothetical protein
MNAKKTPTAALLTTKETAALLDIVPDTLSQWRSEGRGPRFSRPSGTSRGRAAYAECDVRTWLAAQKAKAAR